MIFCKKFGEESYIFTTFAIIKLIFDNDIYRRSENGKSIRETVGKFFFDLAKTSYTAMVIGGSGALITGMAEALSYAILLGVGVILTVLLTIFVYYILKHK